MTEPNHGERIAVLEANYKTLQDGAERNYHLLAGQINEKLDALREVLLDRIDGLDHAVNGNGGSGRKGILDRLTALESRVASDDREQEASDRAFDRIKPFIPYLVGAAGFAALYWLKK